MKKICTEFIDKAVKMKFIEKRCEIQLKVEKKVGEKLKKAMISDPKNSSRHIEKYEVSLSKVNRYLDRIQNIVSEEVKK